MRAFLAFLLVALGFWSFPVAAAEDAVSFRGVRMEAFESSMPVVSQYAVRRFVVENTNPETVEVEVFLPATPSGRGSGSRGYGQQRGLSRVSRRVEVSPGTRVTVELAYPALGLDGFDVGLLVNDRTAPNVLPLVATGGHRYGYEITWLIDPRFDDRALRERIQEYVEGGASHGYLFDYFELESLPVNPARWRFDLLEQGLAQGMLLSSASLEQLPREEVATIMALVFQGATLAVDQSFTPFPGLRTADALMYRREAAPAKVDDLDENHDPIEVDADVWTYGVGKVIRLRKPLDTFSIPELTGILNPQTQQGEYANTRGASLAMPLIDQDTVPVDFLFFVLVTVAVLLGPVSLFVLGKWNQRIHLAWVVPVGSVVTAGFIAAIALLAEGFRADERTFAAVYLDQESQLAAIYTLYGCYLTLPPAEGLTFPMNAYVQPVPESYYQPNPSVRNRFIDLTNGQNFVAGWVGPREPTYFTVRQLERRRERLSLSRAGEQLQVLNGLGAGIELLYVRLDAREVLKAAEIPAGERGSLAGSDIKLVYNADDSVRFVETVNDKFEGFPGINSTLEQLAQLLPPRTYVARLNGAPFFSSPLAEGTSQGNATLLIGQLSAEELP